MHLSSNRPCCERDGKKAVLVVPISDSPYPRPQGTRELALAKDFRASHALRENYGRIYSEGAMLSRVAAPACRRGVAHLRHRQKLAAMFAKRKNRDRALGHVMARAFCDRMGKEAAVKADDQDPFHRPFVRDRLYFFENLTKMGEKNTQKTRRKKYTILRALWQKGDLFQMAKEHGLTSGLRIINRVAPAYTSQVCTSCGHLGQPGFLLYLGNGSASNSVPDSLAKLS